MAQVSNLVPFATLYTQLLRSEDWNTPPAFANESDPGYSVATDKFLLIQSVVVDGIDRVWALDTGRPRVNGSTLLATVPGGPKLMGFYLNGTNFAVYTFPSDVVYADSSLNDVRFDLRGDGWAYITDSSPQRPGIVVLNLATGASWRHLTLHPSVSVDPFFLPVYNGGKKLPNIFLDLDADPSYSSAVSVPDPGS